VVCIVGDGAFQMYMKELPTAVQYKAGYTWVVLNNSAFGWIKYNQKNTLVGMFLLLKCNLILRNELKPATVMDRK